MSKILIVYFSREGEAYVDGKTMLLPVGNTHVAAEMIQDLTVGDVFRIEPATPYPYNHMQTIDVAKKELQGHAALKSRENCQIYLLMTSSFSDIPTGGELFL